MQRGSHIAEVYRTLRLMRVAVYATGGVDVSRRTENFCAFFTTCTWPGERGDQRGIARTKEVLVPFAGPRPFQQDRVHIGLVAGGDVELSVSRRFAFVVPVRLVYLRRGTNADPLHPIAVQAGAGIRMRVSTRVLSRDGS